jgi:hypothetical protein
VEYTNTFQGGIRVETFTIYEKRYVGPIFLDTVIDPNCEVLDTIQGGQIALTWTAPGNDGYIGQASEYEGFFGDSTSIVNGIAPKFIVPYPQPAGWTEHIVLFLDINSKYYFAVRSKDEIGNVSDLSNLASGVTSNVFYKQIYYVQDTTYLVLKTFPDSLQLPDNIVRFGEIGIDTSHVNFKNMNTVYFSPMRRKDNTMNDFVDLTDLVTLIAYLTRGGQLNVSQSLDSTKEIATNLKQNYPNPFNAKTRINFSLKEAGYVRVTVYNILGQLVRVLLSEEKPAGDYLVYWDGRDDYGATVASSVYFYRFESRNNVYTKKMLLLK